MTTITIREKSNNTQNEYQATVSFNKDEFSCTITNPYSNEQVSDLEWYFKEYPHDPDDEDQEKAKSVAASIKKCGQQLFEQVFCNRALMRRYDQEKHTGIQCIEIIGSPAFHSLPWETLHDPYDSQPLALALPIVRQYTSETKVLNVRQSPIINLLIVTARPNRENDIDYRAISRPLVESLRKAKLRVNIDILRPSTYHAFKDHLSQCQNGYYHIIHLDVHGALQGDNSFVYLDSAEPENRADPIEATQLAQLLVQRRDWKGVQGEPCTKKRHDWKGVQGEPCTKKRRDWKGVQGEPCTGKPCSPEYKANLVRESRVLRSTRRTLYEKAVFSGVQGEPCARKPCSQEYKANLVRKTAWLLKCDIVKLKT